MPQQIGLIPVRPQLPLKPQPGIDGMISLDTISKWAVNFQDAISNSMYDTIAKAFGVLNAIYPLSFTTGDLLYASSATTIAGLADVAVGSVLQSGGVGVAPHWGAASGAMLSDFLLMGG